MTILEDSRNQAGKHKNIHDYCDLNGIRIVRTKLIVGDYTLPTNHSVCIDTKQDLLGNPVCSFIITHAPDKGREGIFWTYEEVFRGAYNYIGPAPGDAIRDALEPAIPDLFTEYRIGVQMGVRSNSKRGIRIISLL